MKTKEEILEEIDRLTELVHDFKHDMSTLVFSEESTLDFMRNAKDAQSKIQSLTWVIEDEL